MNNFPDDDNTRLKKVQERLFPRLGKLLYSSPAVRYITASRFIGVRTELLSTIRAHLRLKDFALENYARIYDYLAIWYRFSRDDHGQLPLPFKGNIDYEEILVERWVTFFRETLSDLTCDDNLALLLIRLAIDPDGIPSPEEELMFRLKKNYLIPALRNF